MAPNPHIKKAYKAMKDLGINDAQIKPVLKNLLNLYDKNWDLIADDNYRALADAIFDSQETQASEEKKGKEKKADEAEGSAAEVERGKRKANESVDDDEDALDEPERPLKRLRRRGEAGSASAFNNPNLGSPSSKETTAHDQETTPVLLPVHPLPTENDPDADALIMPKGEPFTDIPFTSTHQAEMEETNGHLEQRDGAVATHTIPTTIERSSEHKLAATIEGSSTLALVSSPAGKVKINLSFAPATGGSNLHAPSMDQLRRAMEDVCLRQYKILDPNFSVSRFLNDIASSYLELATKEEKPANQLPENLPSVTTNADVLKKSAAAMASTAEGSNDLATKARNSANQSPENMQTHDHVREDENNGVGESVGLVVVPECQISADEFRVISSVSDITFGKETVEIPWVNEVNSKVPPPFRYIAQSLVHLDAEVKFSLGNIKADEHCSSCCGDCLSPSMACSCATALSGFRYTKDGLLQQDFLEDCISEAHDPQKRVLQYCQECPSEIAKNEETLEACKGHRKRKVIRECWSNCGCTQKCGNRVVQNGIHIKLQVFFTSNGRGWGLRTLEKLPKGAFVCELAGEILTISELVQRSSEKLTSPVMLDAHWGSEEVSGVNKALCLDGTHYGNISRFINHRCGDANLIEIPVHVENMDLHYYHLGLFATRDIEAMEELTWDYGVEFNDHVYPTRPFHCRCGSEFCPNVKRIKKKKSKKRHESSQC
ncbi:unnamed protein product [Eruca vesicaria subsp. sativa]|uniref:SET domain-containing protein n=1 Tax=Eruca vesicaria subsp. sativa TaxID=29727 RepID=A0ABC8JF79_ERUVS|nr:unnamed protein product [Eruca vesicaria subsp. sativa]